VRLSPPLVIDRDQCETALRLLAEALEEVETSFEDEPR
jgi:4-aminobutyrate aminotransferase-like enzyme